MPEGAQLRGQVGGERQPTLPWPSHAPQRTASSVQWKGSLFLSTKVSLYAPTQGVMGLHPPRGGPFSNDTKVPLRPTKAPCMSTSWDGEERLASKAASTLSGADRDCSFFWPSLAPLCPLHSDYSVRTPCWPAEALHEGSKRVWIRRQTEARVSRVQITVASTISERCYREVITHQGGHVCPGHLSYYK